MMKHHTRILLCAIGLAAVSACAHPAASSSGTALSPDPKNDIVITPRMTGGTGMMSFGPLATQIGQQPDAAKAVCSVLEQVTGAHA